MYPAVDLPPTAAHNVIFRVDTDLGATITSFRGDPSARSTTAC